MKYKKTLIVSLVLVLAVGLCLYFFQSRVQEKPETPTVKQDLGKVAQKESQLGKSKVVSNKTATSTSKPRKAQNQTSSTRPKRGESNQTRDNRTQEKKLSPLKKHDIITKYFLQDLTEYIVSHYYPPHSKNNPEDTGKNSVSFRALNARYGLDMTGLRVQSDSLDKARQKILETVLKPRVLNRLYSLYSDEFIGMLAKEARTQKYTSSNGRSRNFSPGQIKEMFLMNSKYLQDVAAVFEIMASKPFVFGLIKDHLRSSEISRDAYKRMKHIQNRYNVLKREVLNKETNSSISDKINNLKNRKKVSAREYRMAIQEREKLRKRILQAIKQEDSELDIENYQILYISKWVYRRHDQGIKNSAILEVADVLQDLSGKLKQKAENVS